MTRQKDLKTKIRARMQKTGESYTAARRQLLAKRPTVAVEVAPAPAPKPKRSPHPPRPAESGYAALAGMSDDSVKAKTGCDWQAWVEALDYRGAADWSHRATAEHVQETYRLSGWWAQMVTVGYERIKGLRAIGQRRDGDFEASKSRTFAVPVAELFRAWSDARQRRKWLVDAELTIRKSTRDRSIRMTWSDGSPVELWFIAKGEAKSAVQVQHRKLASRETADARKREWTERLKALEDWLRSR